MKVIDLLNKIANGEEVPKKIKFDNKYWNRICSEKYPYYVNDNDSDLFIYFFRKNLTFSLNDEVEIIEEHNEEPQEHKIPEKIKDKYCSQISKVKLAQKVNEILDYLEKIK